MSAVETIGLHIVSLSLLLCKGASLLLSNHYLQPEPLGAYEIYNDPHKFWAVEP